MPSQEALESEALVSDSRQEGILSLAPTLASRLLKLPGAPSDRGSLPHEWLAGLPDSKVPAPSGALPRLARGTTWLTVLEEEQTAI